MDPLSLSVLAGGLVAAGVSVIIMGWGRSVRKPSKRVEEYLGRDGDDTPGFRERVVLPIMARISRIGNAIYPPRVIEKLDECCLHAGRPFRLRGERLAGLKLFCALFPGGVTLIAVPGPARLFAAILVGCLGYVLPGLWISSRIKQRFSLARGQLADAMDLLVVSVEAGLGLDMAMSRVAERLRGPVGQAFSKALSEISLGESRENALKGISRRLPLDEIRHFVNSLIQAEQLGVSLGGVLRSQADTLRRHRRLKAEEQARKAPVKMLFPLVIFIFPSLFVVILGPAVINIVKELSM